MSARRLFRLMYGSLAVLYVGLVGTNMWLSSREIEIGPLNDMNASRDESHNDKEAEVSLLGAEFPLQETLSRPLFSPTRREFEPEYKQHEAVIDSPAVTQQVIGALSLPAIVLRGTRMINQEQQALISVQGSELGDWLSVGANVSGWRIEKISESNIVLSNENQKATYELFSSGEGQSGASSHSPISHN